MKKLMVMIILLISVSIWAKSNSIASQLSLTDKAKINIKRELEIYSRKSYAIHCKSGVVGEVYIGDITLLFKNDSIYAQAITGYSCVLDTELNLMEKCEVKLDIEMIWNIDECQSVF